MTCGELDEFREIDCVETKTRRVRTYEKRI